MAKVQLNLFNDSDLISDIPKGSEITVWFSCGAASAVAAKKTIELFGDSCQIRVVNNPVLEEHPDNRRFLTDVESWIGQKIEIAINPKYPDCSAEQVWAKKKAMAFPTGAPCTTALKKKARQYWESNNSQDYLVLGFTREEWRRSANFQKFERTNLLPVLMDLRISKQDCVDLVQSEGLRVPEIYSLGFPNANCIGCPKASSPTYWNLVRTHFPDIFQDRSRQSRELGARLVQLKGDRIFLDQLSPSAVGNDLKSMSVACGIFCEEDPTTDINRIKKMMNRYPSAVRPQVGS